MVEGLWGGTENGEQRAGVGDGGGMSRCAALHTAPRQARRLTGGLVGHLGQHGLASGQLGAQGGHEGQHGQAAVDQLCRGEGGEGGGEGAVGARRAAVWCRVGRCPPHSPLAALPCLANCMQACNAVAFRCSPGAGPEKAMIWSRDRLAALPEMLAPAAPPVGAAGVVMLPLATAAFHCGQAGEGGGTRGM